MSLFTAGHFHTLIVSVGLCSRMVARRIMSWHCKLWCERQEHTWQNAKEQNIEKQRVKQDGNEPHQLKCANLARTATSKPWVLTQLPMRFSNPKPFRSHSHDSISNYYSSPPYSPWPFWSERLTLSWNKKGQAGVSGCCRWKRVYTTVSKRTKKKVLFLTSSLLQLQGCG